MSMYDWMHGGDDDDDDDAPLTLAEKRDWILEMIQHAKENEQALLSQKVIADGEALVAILDEGIQIENNVNAHEQENATISDQNQALLEEINTELEALAEEERGIDEEINEIDQELAAALKADPPDEKLIAKLREQKKELEVQKQQCIADRQRLLQSHQKSTKVSQQCGSIKNQCNKVLTSSNYSSPNVSAGGASSAGSNAGKEHSGKQQESSNQGADQQGISGNVTPRTADDICKSNAQTIESYLQVEAPLVKNMGEQEQQIKAQLNENKQAFAEVKQEVAEVKTNRQSRSERMQAMKNERAAYKAQSTPAATGNTAPSSEQEAASAPKLPPMKPVHATTSQPNIQNAGPTSSTPSNKDTAPETPGTNMRQN